MRRGTFFFLVLLVLAAPSFADSNVVVNNVDPAGVGFNDPTPATPVGGNPGVTVGEQRLNVFEFAADLWGATIDSNADIVVQATFSPLPCGPTSGTLGAAGTIQIFTLFPGEQVAFHWHHGALANALAGVDLVPGPPDPGLLVPPFADDIVAFFNGDIAGNPACLGGATWYYGYDNNPGPGEIDLLNVLMHEIAHGLGFSNFANETTGALQSGIPDIYTFYSFDNTLGVNWDALNDAGRQFSATNDGNLVWTGAHVQAKAPDFLGPQLVADAGGLGVFIAQQAAFGPSADGLSGALVLADDGVGVGSDGCEPLVNNVAGSIALIDRGSCNFSDKALNAQNAGAIGVAIANNAAGGPAPVGGTGPSVTIPTIGVSLDAGNILKGGLPGASLSVGFSATLLSGADAAGRPKLYAPTVVAQGSSVSHWDVSATPNLLMEPFNSPDLVASETTDLTPYLLQDEGWQLADRDGDGFPNIEDTCVDSDTTATVVIDGCDSGVANAGVAEGCTISDLIADCAAGASNHGGFVSCVSHLLNDLKADGIISGRDKGRIQRCAARSSIP